MDRYPTDSISPLYQLFGVDQLVLLLQRENKQAELLELEQTISQFILLQSLADLSSEQQETLAGLPVADVTALYAFFKENIPQYQEKLKDYGIQYRNTIIES
ncbi:hypothetical protein KA082_00885 [Candidatus Woesebacteria bacterium]|nr:hypothetical protein [Candidatus Woesebacteria bacterium]